MDAKAQKALMSIPLEELEYVFRAGGLSVDKISDILRALRENDMDPLTYLDYLVRPCAHPATLVSFCWLSALASSSLLLLLSLAVPRTALAAAGFFFQSLFYSAVMLSVAPFS